MLVKVNLKNFLISCVGLFFIWLLYALWRTKDYNVVESVTIDLKELINYSILAAERGGYAVERVFSENKFLVKTKGKTKEGADEVLTRADIISHLLIYETLNRLPGINKKLISEESAASLVADDVDQYKLNSYDLWLPKQRMINNIPSQNVPISSITVWIDPLDATQEFTEGLTQYVSVMICIAIDGKPKFGVIHRPFLHETVWGLVGYGTHPKYEISKRNKPDKVVVSRSHAGKVKELIEKQDALSKFSIEPAGGAGYKTLRVLNGTAAAYVHSTAIKKWDLCAADAVITAAGGRMTSLNGDDLTYFSRLDAVTEKGVLVTLGSHFHLLKHFRNDSISSA